MYLVVAWSTRYRLDVCEEADVPEQPVLIRLLPRHVDKAMTILSNRSIYCIASESSCARLAHNPRIQDI